ncbi:MAG: hypothetical protein C5S38_02155 [Candidatus Methanophagaceae archaeon]|nr:MAG: hypothetical protein C5S38_02155 [Methanophagales archaeon]KAF5429326.1 Transglutaminase-like enzyme, putative cysteine protease [Methanophagales archaeon]
MDDKKNRLVIDEGDEWIKEETFEAKTTSESEFDLPLSKLAIGLYRVRIEGTDYWSNNFYVIFNATNCRLSENQIEKYWMCTYTTSWSTGPGLWPGTINKEGHNIWTSHTDKELLLTMSSISSNVRNDRPYTEDIAINNFAWYVSDSINYSRGTDSPDDIKKFIEDIKSGNKPDGDCDEYAAFLVALARSSGIPARLIIGVGNVNGRSFDWNHAWTEVYYHRNWKVWDSTTDEGSFDSYQLYINTRKSLNSLYDVFDERDVDRCLDYGGCDKSRDRITGVIRCPANLHAYDSQGRHVGVNELGDIDLEIPDAYYTGPDSEPESIVIFDQTEDITFKIDALDTGEFDFTLIQNSDTKTTNVTYRDVPITETTEATVDVSQANPAYTMEIDDNSDGVADREKKPTNITVSGSQSIFDTRASANPYPSLSGTHTGTITPSQDVNVSKLYTYPCAGTGGHTESVRISGNGKDESASWNGYAEDGHTITFDSSFLLESGKTYNYVIKTGSYPQIHHTKELQTDYGWLNCTKFTDANGKEYDDWIPAIRLGT